MGTLTMSYRQERKNEFGGGMKNLKRWALLACLYSSGGALFAQNSNSGDIRGTVTDTTGALIPGVKVDVRDVDKGVVKTYVTNGAGLYDTGSITPDHYLLNLYQDGFRNLGARSDYA
jgi:hypothetical protein